MWLGSAKGLLPDKDCIWCDSSTHRPSQCILPNGHSRFSYKSQYLSCLAAISAQVILSRVKTSKENLQNTYSINLYFLITTDTSHAEYIFQSLSLELTGHLNVLKESLWKKTLLMIFINIQISYTSIKLNLLPDQLTILILVENWVESDLVFNHMSADYKIMVVWFVSHEYDYRLTSDDTKSTYQCIIKIKIFKKHKK